MSSTRTTCLERGHGSGYGRDRSWAVRGYPRLTTYDRQRQSTSSSQQQTHRSQLPTHTRFRPGLAVRQDGVFVAIPRDTNREVRVTPAAPSP
jgi:hypothetical protein